MTTQSKIWYIAQRGELLAQEFLLELGASFVASLQQADVGLDYMAFFAKEKHGVISIGIQVKATEREINGKYTMPSSLIMQLQSSNIPVLVIVCNVKDNDIFFNWAHDLVPHERQDLLKRSQTCTVTLRQSTIEERAKLKEEVLLLVSDDIQR